MSLTLSAAVLLTVALAEGIIVPSGPVATSFASTVRGDGNGYGYNILHEPHTYNAIGNEVYPYAYGGVSTYSPQAYGHGLYPGYLMQQPLHTAGPVNGPNTGLPHSYAPYAHMMRHPWLYPAY